jgi:glycosyltransferase involved in cell wall biosynthesis
VRVLQLLEPGDGGVAVHVRALTEGLIGRGHQVDAVTSRGPLAGELKELGAGVVEVDLHPEIGDLIRDARTFRKLAATMRAGPWDLVHTHGNKGGVLGRLSARLAALPVVHTPHGFAYRSQASRERRAQGLRRALTFGVEKALSPLAAAIVCVSEWELAETLRDGVAGPDRLVVVHNGVPITVEAEPDAELRAFRDGAPLIGFLARLHPEKAPLVLSEAFARLAEQGVAFRGVLIGDGPLAEAVEHDLARRGLADQVLVRPFSGDPNPALAAFDLYVLPSLWESLPLGALEAMAHGLPVVACDVGGVAEAVVDGRTGLLVAPADVEALTGALARLAIDQDERRRMGESGRLRCREHFSVERMVESTERVYERVVAATA